MVAVVLSLSACTSAEEISDRIEREVDERVDRNVDRAVERGADETEDAIKDTAKGKEDGEGDGDTPTRDTGSDDASASADTPSSGEAAAMRPGEGVWANYDFVPGSRVLFFDDFTDDRVGDFPRSLTFRRGSMDVVEWEGGRALRGEGRGAFLVDLPETLPEQFTLEFDYHTPDFVNDIRVEFVNEDGEPAGVNYLVVDAASRGVGIAAYSRDGVASTQRVRDVLTSAMQPIRLMVDGSYAKVYVGEERVANIPNADLGRTSTLRFDLADVRSKPVYISNLRVAAGGRDLYAQIEADGKAVTRGILFDTGSAQIRPESTPTLKDIARMLENHPDLRLRIEGHTDATGSDQTNQSLSQQRAEAVMQYLVNEHGIDSSRLQAVGKGEGTPVASNDTPEGRQSNRRVELVRL
jgi:outer membrane protein OmpA-like peptidoglycan-associated protein